NGINRLHELAQILRDKRLRRRSFLQRATITNEHQQLSERRILRNLNRYALHKLLARFSPDVSLNLDLLAASNFGAIERDALERARIFRLGRRDIERDAVELNVVKAARQQRADRRGD